MQNADTRIRCLYETFVQQSHTLRYRKRRSNWYSQGGLKALQHIISKFLWRKVLRVSEHIMFMGALLV